MPRIGLALAAPALACLFSLALNAQFTSAPRPVELIVVPGILFGGLATMITAPLQVFHTWRAWRRVTTSVRLLLTSLTIAGLSVMLLVGRYLFGWSNATWL